MSRVLLLDLDHTLYSSTLPTGDAVDSRIVRYIGEHLGLSREDANALRRELSEKYGTTLKGLETLHGVDRELYCDFIQDVDDDEMPPPNPQLRDWLIAVGGKMPIYLFTNARRDWADRCLACLGLTDLLPDILDIGFLDWIGKPDAAAFIRAEDFVRARHGDAGFIFVDDRLDNLEQARLRGWSTVWVRPHDLAVESGLGLVHRIVDSLLELDPESLQ